MPLNRVRRALAGRSRPAAIRSPNRPTPPVAVALVALLPGAAPGVLQVVDDNVGGVEDVAAELGVGREGGAHTRRAGRPSG
jgi:hypothetical protein